MSQMQQIFDTTDLSLNPTLGIKLLDPQATMPKYYHPGDSGIDVYPLGEFSLAPGARKLIKTGIALDIPIGYEIQVRSRSGLALKYGITVLNSPGTIDQKYTGEIGIILINHSAEEFYSNGDNAIAQLVLCKVGQARIKEVADLNKSERGDGGFGSTDNTVDNTIQIKKPREYKYNEVKI